METQCFCPSGPGTRFSRVQTCDRLATIIQARIGSPRHEGPTCLPHVGMIDVELDETQLPTRHLPCHGDP